MRDTARMGQQRLGRIPGSKKFQQVIALIVGGAGASAIAEATSRAAETQLVDAGRDAGVQYALWLLTQIPLAARSLDFASALRALGLSVSDQPMLTDVVAAMTEAIDEHLRQERQRTDLSEIAQLCAAETLQAVAGIELPDLLGNSPDLVRAAVRGLATEKQFAILARDFFARLTQRLLNYFLSCELPKQIGPTRRFQSLREASAFDAAMDLHCREATRIMKEYAGVWFSKHTYEGGITPLKAGRFVNYALRKLRAELRNRRSPIA